MPYLNDERYKFHWQMSERQLKLKLGVPIRLPSDFTLPPTDVDGTKVYILPSQVDGRKFHRVIAICPICDKDIPAGRLHQHLTVHGIGKLPWRNRKGS